MVTYFQLPNTCLQRSKLAMQIDDWTNADKLYAFVLVEDRREDVGDEINTYAYQLSALHGSGIVAYLFEQTNGRQRQTAPRWYRL